MTSTAVPRRELRLKNRERAFKNKHEWLCGGKADGLRSGGKSEGFAAAN